MLADGTFSPQNNPFLNRNLCLIFTRFQVDKMNSNEIKK